MNPDYSVSAIITTYNRKESVIRALRSVIKQTRQPDEIILVDDGSSDGTEHVILDAFPQIKYIKQENRGISSARNTGIIHSTSQWLAFLDSDDEWLVKKLEKQLDALTLYPSYRICHSDELWIRKGHRVNPKKKHQKYGGDIFIKCLPLCVISPSAVIIHRELFKKYGLFDTALPACEDYDMWLRLCAYIPVLFIEEPLIIKYGGHPDQLSAKYWGLDRFRIYALEKIISEMNLDPAKKKAAVEMLIHKIDVYIKGAMKRGKLEEVSEYLEKRKKYHSKNHPLIFRGSRYSNTSNR